MGLWDDDRKEVRKAKYLVISGCWRLAKKTLKEDHIENDAKLDLRFI